MGRGLLLIASALMWAGCASDRVDRQPDPPGARRCGVTDGIVRFQKFQDDLLPDGWAWAKTGPLKVVSGDYTRDGLACNGPACDSDDLVVVGQFSVVAPASPAGAVHALECAAAAEKCDVLDLAPRGTLNGRGELDGAPTGGACLVRPPNNCSVEYHRWVMSGYPASLPACPTRRPAISVRAALAHSADDAVTIRGRIKIVDSASTLMDCPGVACCNATSYLFGLVDANGAVLELQRWGAAPPFGMDCDPDLSPWLGALNIVVSGYLTDTPRVVLGMPRPGRALVVEQTCRLAD